MLILLVIVALLVFLVLFGALGLFGVAAAAFIIAFVWYIVPIVLMILLGTLSLAVEPILKRISPRTWEMVQANIRAEAARKKAGLQR